ncbi:hypothetical protein [Micromonospora sp. RTGN7]|uniref:hypothetical protein n=1 Tax=Micromonospora sp. RTGN7 TaxID=3016526 RepID=UPI0029FF4194|nr:hypothetical protein [Micromonospora sp. RTGN7]
MDERPHTGPLPHAHPVVDGRAPLADGQTVPQPPRRLPLATREVIAGWICAAVVLVLLVVGIAGLLR